MDSFQESILSQDLGVFCKKRRRIVPYGIFFGTFPRSLPDAYDNLLPMANNEAKLPIYLINLYPSSTSSHPYPAKSISNMPAFLMIDFGIERFPVKKYDHLIF